VLAPFVTAVTAEPIGISSAVGHAFAIAAATFAPLLILGVWWTRLTAKGAAAGVLVGGTTTSLAAIVSVLALAPEGWPGALVAA
ncbi:cation acetate symporter, partial [Enterobacter hormaechei]|nr:cation acetate symporter [Enterobacter hormaechei]